MADLESDPSVEEITVSTPTRGRPEEVVSFIKEQYGAQDGRRPDDVAAVGRLLLDNAVEHGNEYNPKKLIKVLCLWQRCFYLAVQDQGQGFDVDNPPFVPGRSGIPPEGGMGIEFARQRADLLYNDGSAVIGVFVN